MMMMMTTTTTKTTMYATTFKFHRHELHRNFPKTKIRNLPWSSKQKKSFLTKFRGLEQTSMLSLLAYFGEVCDNFRTNHCFEFASRHDNKNLAIANRSRVSCAHKMPRASVITPWP